MNCSTFLLLIGLVFIMWIDAIAFTLRNCFSGSTSTDIRAQTNKQNTKLMYRTQKHMDRNVWGDENILYAVSYVRIQWSFLHAFFSSSLWNSIAYPNMYWCNHVIHTKAHTHTHAQESKWKFHLISNTWMLDVESRPLILLDVILSLPTTISCALILSPLFLNICIYIYRIRAQQENLYNNISMEHHAFWIFT